jgi:hypothetical protein
MSDRAQLEARLLKAAELELVSATRPPAIEQLSVEQLKVLAQRCAQALVVLPLPVELLEHLAQGFRLQPGLRGYVGRGVPTLIEPALSLFPALG